ncbi:barstar family protein [Stenotrophomonas sp. MMGLT7]|uniref:barstar family protein n=1 Tax=Stenotrophomonas sp. MMGLT7 TaxID=2901227 RepID=UPI001E30B7E9|nr:barstar family protein [Stenotrophomonas sp. MMGLT7]MCD7098739.1 barstar family protein [Stenotrophomonas sp. MMGLT7]
MSNDFDLALGDAASSGVYQVAPGDLDALAALARDAGLRICRIDLRGCRDKRTLLLRLSAQLDFPPGFGRNWDALSDALRDLSWLPAPGGYALLFEDAAELQAQAQPDFATLLDILDEAAQRWAGERLPFVCFLDLPGSAAA